MSKDRKDGRYIKPNDAIHAIMPYLMEKRTESEVYKSQLIDITELKKWVDTKNKELDFKMTYFHALTALLVKVLYNRNLLNRFVQGHRIYERNYVSVTFAAKDKMSDNAEEKMIVLKIDKKDNGVKLAKKMAVDIFKVRKEGTNDLDQTLKVITRMPRWLLRIFAKFVKWLDYHGWLPSSFTDTDPNYSTLLLSNLGSIKSEELREDREVMLEAVKNAGNALYYASEELKNDREVVATALENDGYAFVHASWDLQGDEELRKIADRSIASIRERQETLQRVKGKIETAKQKEAELEALRREAEMEVGEGEKSEKDTHEEEQL